MSEHEKAVRWLRRRVWLALTCGVLMASAAHASEALAVSWGPGVKATLPADAGHDPHGPAPDTALTSVSCPSAGDCGAVGSYLSNAQGRRGLLLSESGGTWAAGAEATLPADFEPRGPGVELRSVSCPSAGECTAVGAYSYDVFAHYQGLLVSESGGVWGAGVKAPLPSDAGSTPDAFLTSVSCASAGNCGAVGSYGSGRGLLLSESSGVWTAVPATLPADASPNPNVALASVSCASAGNCSAVGYYEDKAGDRQGLLLNESGGVWAAGTKAALPADGRSDRDVVLSSVSCPSAGKCSAVGSYSAQGAGTQGLLLRRSGGAWATGVRATLPADASTNPAVALSAVSCASAGSCGAVGSYRDSSSRPEGLLLSKSGGAWATGVRATLPAGAGSNPSASLSAVSCPSAGNCNAIGSYSDSKGNTQGLLLNQSSGAWAMGVTAPLTDASRNPYAFLNSSSVSCPSALDCSAVGSYVDRSHQQQGALLGTVSGGATHTLTVAEAGSGQGTVASSPAGIDCGQTCSAQFDAASAVTLIAIPAPGSVFAGWSGGGCSGPPTCPVTMSSDQSVSATFNVAKPPDTEIIKARVNQQKRRAKFNFKANGNATGFECKLKRKQRTAEFTGCRSPQIYVRLKPSLYTFKVRAMGPGGTDTTPARETFVIEP